MDILSFSPVVPFEGIPHAGGAYVLVHLQALVSAGHRVTLVAPDGADNRAAADGLEGVRVVLVGDAPAGRPDLRARFRPALPPVAWERAVARSAVVRDLVSRADLVEYQWTQTARLHRAIGAGARVPAVCIAHDVVSQLARRQAERAGTGRLERAVRILRARGVQADERGILRRMRSTVTFSAKDADLLERHLGVTGVRVVAPPLEPLDSRWQRPRSPRPGEVVFVGAFDREENADAAHWLIDDIWPRIHDGARDAVLHLIGANPTPHMLGAAARDGSILVSGYVEDLVPWYEEASVVVVPLREGAGVKFKTVTAMLWGVPVVSTTVGVEGIAPADSPVFATVTDDATRFADGVLEVLSTGDSTVGPAAREYATARYGRGPFVAAIDGLYRELTQRDRTA